MHLQHIEHLSSSHAGLIKLISFHCLKGASYKVLKVVLGINAGCKEQVCRRCAATKFK